MRFNTSKKDSDKTTNYEGDVAYKLTPELELYSTVCTASLQQKYYEGSDDTIERIRKLIKEVNPSFTAKLAVYAREKMYLRSVPLLLTVELAKIHNGDQLVSQLTERVIQRADEIAELLAYYQQANNRADKKKLGKLSKQLQKGIARAFLKFDEYQFGKYNREGDVTLRDALFLAHPKSETKEQEELFKKITEDTLAIPYTWEVELSEAGKKGKEKKTVWEELIDSKKMGYMATLRNLRNILDAGVSLKHLQKVAEYLANPVAVKNSRQLPFRFLSAYKELSGNDSPYTNMILEALEEAVLISVENIKGYDYNTSVCIACDVSGSMNTPISPKSKVENYDIGLVLGMLLQNKCKAVITGIFGDKWKIKQLPKRAILQNVEALRQISSEVGWSTNGYLVLKDLIDRKVAIDKIMMFTDCQMWDSYDEYQGKGAMKTLWSKYKAFHPTAKLYLFDLTGYGNTPVKVNDNDVCFIAGWSDKVFEVLDALEKGKNAIELIKEIDLNKPIEKNMKESESNE